MSKKNIDILKKHLPAILFLIFYLILLAWKTISNPTPFFDWDESIYAQVGREMTEKTSLLVPLWQGKAWLDKPPIPSLFYGLVQLLPLSPEISTRIATAFLSIIVLGMLYALSLRVSRDKLASLLTIMITAFLPIFFQRSIALNVDVFLLLGWLGYVLFYENLAASTLFLILAVLSKSLLGYLPPALFFLYHLCTLLIKQTNAKQFATQIRNLFIQCGFASLWFIFMLVLYGYDFIQYQFIDSHFKRVSSSIEQHFGQRTFYITVLIDQFKLLLLPALVSALFLAYRFFITSKKEKHDSLLGLLFLPWFLFLNLTKTKIEWYIYPVLPQFALLAAYPVSFFRKNNYARYGLFAALAALYFFTITPVEMLVTQPFSRWEDHQKIALFAKTSGCRTLEVLVSEDTRTSYATLKSMDLVISTTTWWGNHPSMAYYSGAHTSFLYNLKTAQSSFASPTADKCIVIEKKDKAHLGNMQGWEQMISSNPTYYLYRAL